MIVKLDPTQPIWLQLVREFARRIATGDWPAGSRIPSVRELASELGINPNTVQRALAELERDGLAYSERTSGRFVTTDEERAHSVRMSLAETAADAFVQRARGLGLTSTQAQSLIGARWARSASDPDAPTATAHTKE